MPLRIQGSQDVRLGAKGPQQAGIRPVVVKISHPAFVTIWLISLHICANLMINKIESKSLTEPEKTVFFGRFAGVV